MAYVGAIAAIGVVVASGGAVLAAAAAALATGAGGAALGGLLAKWLGDRHAREVTDHLRHGGLLLWVNVRDTEHEEAATRILTRHAASAVRAHDIAVADPSAGPGPNLEPYLVGVPFLFRVKA